MAATGRRSDLIDSQADQAERVRKLEIMHVSRSLRPRIWQPDHSHTEDIAQFLYIACGVGAGQRRPLSAIAHGLYQDARFAGRSVAESLAQLAHHCAVGPKIDGLAEPFRTLEDAYVFSDQGLYYPDGVGAGSGGGAVPGFVRSMPIVSGFSKDWRRVWLYAGLPCSPPETFPDSWQFYPVGSTRGFPPVMMEMADDLGFLLAEHLDENTQTAANDHFYLTRGYWCSLGEDPAVSRSNVYSVGENLVDCGGPELKMPWQGGFPIMYSVDPNSPCPLNPLSTGAAGEIQRSFVQNPATDAYPVSGPRPETTNEANVNEPAVTYADLVARVQMVADSDSFQASGAKGALAWCNARIPVIEANLRRSEREGWQRLPLHPGWFGAIEVRYNERTVFLRGRAICLAENPSNSLIAYYPPELPIGLLTNPGTALLAQTVQGQPVNLYLSNNHRGETGAPGSDITLATPLGPTTGGIEWEAMQNSWEIVLDGVQFARHMGG